MTFVTTLYSIWHAVNGKQSVAAAHLQATAYAADLHSAVALFWPSWGPGGPPRAQNIENPSFRPCGPRNPPEIYRAIPEREVGGIGGSL